MDKTATIYFDLDGTVYPLYSQPDWLPRITTLADPSAYAAEVTIPDAAALMDVLLSLVTAGWKIGVVSWLAKGASEDYNKAVRAVKREWVKKFLPMATEVHIVKYGTPKHQIVSDPHGIIVDDDAGVRAAWKGQTIDGTQDIIAALRKVA